MENNVRLKTLTLPPVVLDSIRYYINIHDMFNNPVHYIKLIITINVT